MVDLASTSSVVAGDDKSSCNVKTMSVMPCSTTGERTASGLGLLPSSLPMVDVAGPSSVLAGDGKSVHDADTVSVTPCSKTGERTASGQGGVSSSSPVVDLAGPMVDAVGPSSGRSISFTRLDGLSIV